MINYDLFQYISITQTSRGYVFIANQYDNLLNSILQVI